MGPFNIIGVGGIDFPIPIIRESQHVNLSAEILYIIFCCNRWMCTGFDGILFCGQTKSIPPHWMQNIVAFMAFISCNNIRGNITQWMPYVETGSGWVGKHIQDIILRLFGMIISAKYFIILPIILPLFLYLFMIVCHI